MKVYKIRDFYYKLFIGMAVLLAGLFLFATMNLSETPLILMVLPFLMITRVFSLCDREILFLKDDHFEWDPGSIGQAASVNYNAMVNIEISENLKSAEIEVKEGNKINKIKLQLEYLEKEVRQEVASFLESKTANLKVA